MVAKNFLIYSFFVRNCAGKSLTDTFKFNHAQKMIRIILER